MKKYLALAAMLLATTSLARADESEQFYRAEVSKDWVVHGNFYPDTEKHHDGCAVTHYWDDGSQFQVIKDLTDNSLYLWMRVIDWNISDPQATEERFQVNAYDARDRFIGGSQLTHYLVEKNTMISMNLDSDAFLKAFVAASSMKFIAPGNIANFTVPIRDLGPKLLTRLAECVKASNKKKSAPSAGNNSGFKVTTPAPIPNLDSPVAKTDDRNKL